MTETTIRKIRDCIFQKIVEESKNINTSYAYEAGRTYIDNMMKEGQPSKVSTNHFIYDNGFYQGKYTMRSQMLILIEDVLDELVKAVIDSGKEA